MFRPRYLMVCAVALLAVPGLRAADEPKDILAKAIKAHGGEEYLTKHQGVRSQEKGKIAVPGVGDVEFTSETSYMLPDKFKNNIQMDVMGQKLKVGTLLNGDKFSVDVTVNGTAIDAGDNFKEAFKDAANLLRVGHLAPVAADKAYKLETFGDATIDEKPCVGIRVSIKGSKDVLAFFDKETSLLAKLEYRAVDPSTGNEVNEERFFKDYKKNKDGIPMAMKLVVMHDGKQYLEMEVIEQSYVEKIDDSEFKK